MLIAGSFPSIGYVSFDVTSSLEQTFDIKVIVRLDPFFYIEFYCPPRLVDSF